MSANWTAWLPSRDSDWPVHRMKKGRIGRFGEGFSSRVAGAVVGVWVTSSLRFPCFTRQS